MAPAYTLYTWGTPNGWKTHIILEELGLDYKLEPIDISTNKQKEDWFLKINPNGKIPALVDHENNDHAVFESGSIMWYLVEKHDKEGKFWPKDFKERSRVISWLMFHMGGVGPMQAQAHLFIRRAPVQLPYAMNRYRDETERLYSVLEYQLAKTEWLAGDSYSIADMANWAYVVMAPFAGVDRNKFPHLKKWVAKIYERPAAQKAVRIPSPGNGVKFLENKADYEQALSSASEKIVAAERNDSAK